MKVLLATGNHDLDKELESALSNAGIATVGPVYYREALKLETVLDEVDAIVISPALGGSTPVNEAILSLRKNDIRVIFLAGSGSGELREAAIGMGVYDIIDDPVQAADVVASVLRPATFASAVGCKLPAAPVVPERPKDTRNGSINPATKASKYSKDENDHDGEEDEAFVVGMWDDGTPDGISAEKEPEPARQMIQPKRSEHDDQPENVSEQPERPPKIGLLARERQAESEKPDVYYVPHQLVAVWSPDGWAKSYTAVNLAAVAAAKGFDSALINYDLSCPELDAWFGIKQTGLQEFDELSAGVMTFEDGFKPELAACCLKKRAWGIQYLPAGNKLGYIGVPNIDADALGQTLQIVYQRNTRGKPAITLVDAGRNYEQASTRAALRQAAIVLTPTDGSPGIAAVTKQQMDELNRLGYSPRFIEVLFATSGRKAAHICQERCSAAFDWMTYLIDREAMKPQCLRAEWRRAWEDLLAGLIAPGARGSPFRKMITVR
jgi:MinD-like ATPase involved in chromosome partitioning or flagellar assembly